MNTTTGEQVSYTLNYGGGGNASGFLVRDTVAMGSFQVPLQPWLLVNQTSSGFLDGVGGAGIMGLAFNTIAVIGVAPFWQVLASGGAFSTPEMSFWITRGSNDPNAPKETFGGIFTLGGQNQTSYQGDIEFLPLVTDNGKLTFWLLNVSGTCRIYLCATPPPHTSLQCYSARR